LDERATIRDFLPLIAATTEDAFSARYDCPFLLGKTLPQSDFRFSTHEVLGSPTSGIFTKSGIGMLTPGNPLMPVRKDVDAVSQARIFLGRSSTNDIPVPELTVSKLHAYFCRDPQVGTRWWVVDAGSANGTKVNGNAIEARARIDLMDGDEIEFGQCKFQWLSARRVHRMLRPLAAGRT
jgi:pSer/pThr/pTyr-binding forkhead associated (FHA) protein